jgi:O-antigen ligase
LNQKKIAQELSTRIDALLFLGVLVPALFFSGSQFEYFSIAQTLLVFWFMWVAWRLYKIGFHLPKTCVTVSLTLFWLWLALSLTWSQAVHISITNFWWVGSLVLVFWIYTLDADRANLWSRVSVVVLIIGLVLGLLGIYQSYVFDQEAESIFETRNTHAAFLNLVALPAAAYYLLAMTGRGPLQRYGYVLAAILFILFLSLFLTASRGAALSLGISVAVLVVFSFKHVTRSGVVSLLLLLVGAFMLAHFTQVEVGQKLGVLLNDAPRLTIWKGAWEMIQEAPVFGLGLGLFYLAYPPYRDPADSSSGFFVHNDYLQIWIETGLLGLILLAAVLISIAWLFIRVLRRPRLAATSRIEIIGLFCGLLAIAGHSFVDFNFYILSIMVTAGLILGRLHEVTCREAKCAYIVLNPSHRFGQRTYVSIVVLCLLFPVSHFAALGLANSYYRKAVTQAKTGELQMASENLATAKRLTPADDKLWIAHGDLFRHAVTLYPKIAEGDRRTLYTDANRFLDEAERLNPLRALMHRIRARLFQENPELTGKDWQASSVTHYERALRLNPMLYRTRTDYAAFLLTHGQQREAIDVLEQGMAYNYHEVPNIIPYYALTARLLRETGNPEAARALEKKIEPIQQKAVASYRLSGH